MPENNEIQFDLVQVPSLEDWLGSIAARYFVVTCWRPGCPRPCPNITTEHYQTP
jgi:hypothetical protein